VSGVGKQVRVQIKRGRYQLFDQIHEVDERAVRDYEAHGNVGEDITVTICTMQETEEDVSQWGPEATTELGRPRCLASFVIELQDGTREHVQCEHGYELLRGPLEGHPSVPHVIHVGGVQFRTAQHENANNHMFQVSWMSGGN